MENYTISFDLNKRRDILMRQTTISALQIEKFKNEMMKNEKAAATIKNI